MSTPYHKVVANANDARRENPDAIIFIQEVKAAAKDLRSGLSDLPKAEQDQILKYAQASTFKAEAGSILALDIDSARSVFILVAEERAEAFINLKQSRKLIEQIKGRGRKRLLVHNPSVAWTDAIVSAVGVANFKPQKFGKQAEKNSAKKDQLSIMILTDKAQSSAISAAAAASAEEAVATNLVRELTLLPANILDCAEFVSRAKKQAQLLKLDCNITDYKKLQQLKAGAFLAVAQGSSHKDSAIVQLSYRSPRSKKKVSLVGKGITFDTGGVNVKPGTSMLGMQGDMMGAAVCLALVSLAAKEKWPINIDAYLAIADNAIGPDAFRPNEVITAANKLTIETIHTDAEGRLILADTLYFASKAKPDLILDFATLTGSAVRAIGTNYSACFSNNNLVYPQLIKAGRDSGERIWPFPLDEDYGECLESDIADTKQCRASGGPDHIEAAMFLKKFIEGDSTWVHVDLAASEHDGGLAHVGTKETGFGVRVGKRIILELVGLG